MKRQIPISFLIAILVGVALFLGIVEASAAAAVPDQGDEPAAGNPDTSLGTKVPPLQRRNPRYKLQVGDTLKLTFPLTPEYDQEITIQPDGYINLQNLADLYVEGMTTVELLNTLKASYAPLLNDPLITVVLKNFEKPHFVAAGEFTTPGKYELTGTTTFLQAVAMAGGIKDGGSHSQVVLFRRVSNDWVEVKKLDMNKIARSQRLGEGLEVMPGDLLYVPRTFLGKIDKYISRASMSVFLNPLGF